MSNGAPLGQISVFLLDWPLFTDYFHGPIALWRIVVLTSLLEQPWECFKNSVHFLRVGRVLLSVSAAEGLKWAFDG